MNYSAYIINMWVIESSDEYDTWFASLDERSKESVFERVLLLQSFGPNLSRPYADSLHGSKKFSNIKELRSRTSEHILRVIYYFDPLRKAFLLTGGDKKGKDQEKFYKNLIKEAEDIIEKHEKNLEKIK